MTAVKMSFANNFWGKDDAGVDPLLARMHHAKQTCDELKAFYNARAAIEEEYSRKLLMLSKKPLGSQEAGSLRSALDTVRGEVEAQGKTHQMTAAQMKSELEEPLLAFAGAMKERRKIVQTGIEKLLKVKVAQTQTVNKTRDRYEQECLKIKGYLAQGHMVMGQEERKNKAKLEKTQINLATSNTEYETAVKILEETTGRWNRDWKAAADKFQDLEEERLDFTKSSLWSFANIASTVCVSDDASCEKVRLSLEGCEVEKDIMSFIKEAGTGQEIPDPPKYINFCRGDVGDNQSIASTDDDNYSVAQFPRTINPSFRTSSPQPSVLESHHDPNSVLARELNFGGSDLSSNRVPSIPGAKTTPERGTRNMQMEANRVQYEQNKQGPISPIQHEPFPMDGMTMLCRPKGTLSDISSAESQGRRASRDSQSDYSNPTSFSSRDPQSGASSPRKEDAATFASPNAEKPSGLTRKKSLGMFNSPFLRRKKSVVDTESRNSTPMNNNRNTWSPHRNTPQTERPAVRQLFTHSNSQTQLGDHSPEPVDPRAKFQLNVGQNIFDVATPDKRGKIAQISSAQPDEPNDPLAKALADLKGITKQSSVRVSADQYAGTRSVNASPAPGSARHMQSPLALGKGNVSAGMRGTPPPSYNPPPSSSLGAPAPAHTSKEMHQRTAKYINGTRDVFGSNSPSQRPESSYGARSQSRPRTAQVPYDMPRTTSPLPARSPSPRPGFQSTGNYRTSSPALRNSPQPQGIPNTPTYSSPIRPADIYARYNSASPAPNANARQASPNPYHRQASPNPYQAQNDELSMSLQLAGGEDVYSSHGGRTRHGHGRSMTGGSQGQVMQRPMSSYGMVNSGVNGHNGSNRARSKSMVGAEGVGRVSKDGRTIVCFAKALYVYNAAIPEELSFGKGDVLAILRLQDDGWWEAEHSGTGGKGLVPSNYLVKI